MYSVLLEEILYIHHFITAKLDAILRCAVVTDFSLQLEMMLVLYSFHITDRFDKTLAC